MGNIAWFTLGISKRNPPRPVDLDEELKKEGLTEEEIKQLWENMDKKLERRKKHWFWKYFRLF
jgi:hypothetical protein